MNRIIQNIKNLNISLDLIIENDLNIHRTTIDCSLLIEPKYELKFADYEMQLKILREELIDYNGPCLYWFSVDSKETAKNIIDRLNQYRTTDKSIKRKIPVKNNNKKSNILYVGKSVAGKRGDGQTNITGRIATHFGYSKHSTIQGLQFRYWTKEKITVNVLLLPNELSEYLEILEKLLAKKLSPLCGRH